MNGVVKNAYKLPGMTFEDVKKTAEFLLEHTKHRPRIGIICGSGLGGLADMVEDPEVFEYRQIPNFPVSTAPGHKGRLVFGTLKGQPIVCMQGRVHMYEGYPMWKVVFPVRVMKMLGVETLIATNAAGGLNDDYKEGDIMIMKDHIYLPGMVGANPLMGPNDERFGPRFPATSRTYDIKLRALGKRVSEELGMDYIKEGVYVMQSGPCYESVTECRLLKLLGADVTGMSTVPEAITAVHCGMRVFAMSLVTNMCVQDFDSDIIANEEEVLEMGRLRSKDMQNLITRFVENISAE